MPAICGAQIAPEVPDAPSLPLSVTCTVASRFELCEPDHAPGLLPTIFLLSVSSANVPPTSSSALKKGSTLCELALVAATVSPFRVQFREDISVALSITTRSTHAVVPTS